MIVIKPVQSNELSVVIDLAKQIWPVCYAHILTPEQIHNMLETIYSQDNLNNEMQSGHHFFSATLNGRPVGYASAYQEENVLWLKKLYVMPNLHGKGIGKQLIEFIIEEFQSAREIRLLVHRDNVSAQQFYNRQKFIQTGEVSVQMGDFKFIDLVFSRKLENCKNVI